MTITIKFSISTITALRVASTINKRNRAVFSPSTHVVASAHSADVTSTPFKTDLEFFRIFTLDVLGTRRRAHTSDVVPHAPRISLTSSLLRVLVSTSLDTTGRLESIRVAFVTENTLIPFSTSIRSLAEVTARAANEVSFIERASIDREAGRTRIDEVAGSRASFLLGVPQASGVSRAVDLVEVTETTLLHTSRVIIIPFTDGTSVFTSRLLTLESTRSTADLAIPNATRILVTSLTTEPLRFTARDTVVSFNIPDTGSINITRIHGTLLGTTVVGSSVTVTVVLTLGIDVVPHASRIGFTFISIEVHVVALLLTDRTSDVPFAHGRLFA